MGKAGHCGDLFLVCVEKIQRGTGETQKQDYGEPALPCSPRPVCLTVLFFLPFMAEKVGANTKWMSEEGWVFSLSASGNQPDITPLGALHLKAAEGSRVSLTTQKKEIQKMPSLSVQPGSEGRSPPAASYRSSPQHQQHFSRRRPSPGQCRWEAALRRRKWEQQLL